MIAEDYRGIALQVKEMLSSDSGYVKESAAPMIGGGFTGDLMPVGYEVFPVRQICKTNLGKTLMDERTFFVKRVIEIDEGNDMIAYVESSLQPIEYTRVLEAWASGFIVQQIDDL
jgi:hypothetical protein